MTLQFVNGDTGEHLVDFDINRETIIPQAGETVYLQSRWYKVAGVTWKISTVGWRCTRATVKLTQA